MDYRELPEEFLEKMKQFLGEEYPEYLASYEEEPRSGAARQHGQADTGTVFFRHGTDGGLEFETSAVDEERFLLSGRTPIQASVVLRGTLLFAGTECDVTGGMAADQAGRPGSGFVRGTGR